MNEKSKRKLYWKKNWWKYTEVLSLWILFNSIYVIIVMSLKTYLITHPDCLCQRRYTGGISPSIFAGGKMGMASELSYHNNRRCFPGSSDWLHGGISAFKK